MKTMTTQLPQGAILPVVGVSFHQEAVRQCVAGQAVLLRHDVTNAFDPWAVVVLTLDGEQLGHLPGKTGLARRLSASCPGGVWEGLIVEVLEGDTTGLRVRVGPLVEQEDPRPGSDREGVREPVDPYEEAAPTQQAYGPGGRLLGEVVTSSETLLRVKGEDGRIRAYPPSKVDVR